MKQIPVRFVIRELPGEEMEDLKSNVKIVSKMILSYPDFELFKYGAGDRIEVENQDGYREWCSIDDLEVIHDRDGVIIIFTLLKVCQELKNISQP